MAGADPLLSDRLREGLNTRLIGARVDAFREAGSTNDLALALAAEGCPDGTVVSADTQVGGRGRLGRAWIAPPDSGIQVSVVLRPPLSPAGAQALTFLGGVAAAAAIRALHGLPVTLKWPNDLYLDGRKLGGVLTELAAESDLIRHAVIGVGINVNLDPATLPDPLPGTATSLSAALGHTVDRLPLLRRLLQELDARYLILRAAGPGALMDEARSLTPMIGRIVRIQHLGQGREGTVVGMDPDGALLLRGESGTVERLLAGDVSILR